MRKKERAKDRRSAHEAIDGLADSGSGGLGTDTLNIDVGIDQITQ